jgi:hypothetical protein
MSSIQEFKYPRKNNKVINRIGWFYTELCTGYPHINLTDYFMIWSISGEEWFVMENGTHLNEGP